MNQNCICNFIKEKWKGGKAKVEKYLKEKRTKQYKQNPNIAKHETKINPHIVITNQSKVLKYNNSARVR